MDNNNKLHLFTSILIKILNCKILPKECMIQSNKFKTILKQFIDHFYVKYNIDDRKLFINSLKKIQHKLLSTDNKHIQYNLFKPKSMIICSDNISESSSISSNDSICSNPFRFVDDNTEKQKDSNNKHSFYAVFVPLSNNHAIKYEFISFDPLIVNQIKMD